MPLLAARGARQGHPRPFHWRGGPASFVVVGSQAEDQKRICLASAQGGSVRAGQSTTGGWPASAGAPLRRSPPRWQSGTKAAWCRAVSSPAARPARVRRRRTRGAAPCAATASRAPPAPAGTSRAKARLRDVPARPRGRPWSIHSPDIPSWPRPPASARRSFPGEGPAPPASTKRRATANAFTPAESIPGRRARELAVEGKVCAAPGERCAREQELRARALRLPREPARRALAPRLLRAVSTQEPP